MTGIKVTANFLNKATSINLTCYLRIATAAIAIYNKYDIEQDTLSATPLSAFWSLKVRCQSKTFSNESATDW